MPKTHRYVSTKKPASSLSVGKKMPEPKQKLTPKQERFAQVVASEYYFGDLTLKETGIKAGFSEKSAEATACKLMKNDLFPHVAYRIKELREEYGRKYGVTYDKHIRDLQTIRDSALEANSFSAAVSAEALRGKAHGSIYVAKSEVRIGQIDGMTREQVLEELAKLGYKQPATLEGESERIDDIEDGVFEEITASEAGVEVLAEVEPDSSELLAYLDADKN